MRVVPNPLLYFDHNATTPVAPEVAEALAASMDVYGNPSSVHGPGQLARRYLEASRRTVADFLRVSPAEIVFTSGGTESNNLALFGLVRNHPQQFRHLITTAVEHPAVLETCRQLEREGVEVTYLRVNSEGLVDVEEVRQSIRPETVLISAMHANNEVGTLQPIAEIAALVRNLRAQGQAIYFHSDGVQALGKIDVHPADLGVDLYSISAHKIYAPKGIGALYVAKGTPVRGTQLGGKHERERRAGTENVTGAIAFARAVELCSANFNVQSNSLRDRFEERVLAAAPGVRVNGHPTKRLPNTSNVRFDGISAEAMVIALDMRGMSVSTGSACSSGSIEASPVLIAMGLDHEEARSSVRFSFGRYNTTEDVDALAEAVVSVASRLRNKARHLVHA